MADPLAHNVEPYLLEFISSFLKKPEFQVVPLAGDASARRYYRVIDGESSWVLMQWEPFEDDGNYPFLSVQRHFLKHQVQVPKVVQLTPAQGLVLLEDLGDLTLERKFWENQNQQLALPFYKLAIDELLKIHFLATGDSASPCTAFRVSFDTAKLLWEMNYGREHLFEKLGRVAFSAKDSALLDQIFNQVCSRLDREPKCVCHRDYHSRNLMLKLGKMRVIDFQDARMGAVQYDLVSLVYDSYVALDEASRETILSYYLERAQADFGYKIDRDHFDDLFYTQVIQRCFKACGSFSSFLNMRGDKRYLKYIRPTLETVVKHIAYYPEYTFMAQVIRDHGFLEKDYENL